MTTLKSPVYVETPRKDWDYVSIDDYSNDMRETSECAAGIITALKREKNDWQAMFWLAVKAAGGKIKIHDHDMANLKFAKEVTGTVWRDDCEQCRVFVFSKGK